MNTFYNPVRIYQGEGALKNLKPLVKSAVTPMKKTLLIFWDESVFKQPELEDLHCDTENVISYPFRASNPELPQLWEVYKETKNLDIGLIVAVGGGSVMDIGKSLCCLHGQSFENLDALREYIQNKEYGAPVCRWIGVPTTAGTGSEVTSWATIWDSQNNQKYSISAEKNYAFAAVDDPALTASMPIALAVSSALDAVTHAAESYWAKATNDVSRSVALGAIRTILDNIDELIEKNTPKARDAMSKGSMLAGLAFSNTRTTACHSVSYPLTMQYHIPHGVAVAMLLGPVFELNLPEIRDADDLLSVFHAQTPQNVTERITSLLKAAGHPTTLREWDVTKDALPGLASHGMTKGRADNNPVLLTESVIHNILESIY